MKEAKAALDAAQERFNAAQREYNGFMRGNPYAFQAIIDARNELRALTGPPPSRQPVQVQPTHTTINFGNHGPSPEGLAPPGPRPLGAGTVYRDVLPDDESGPKALVNIQHTEREL